MPGVKSERVWIDCLVGKVSVSVNAVMCTKRLDDQPPFASDAGGPAFEFGTAKLSILLRCGVTPPRKNDPQ